jgi:hypothetical protein
MFGQAALSAEELADLNTIAERIGDRTWAWWAGSQGPLLSCLRSTVCWVADG